MNEDYIADFSSDKPSCRYYEKTQCVDFYGNPAPFYDSFCYRRNPNGCVSVIPITMHRPPHSNEYRVSCKDCTLYRNKNQLNLFDQ